MNIGIVGLGYVGSSLAAFLSNNNKIYCIDCEENKLTKKSMLSKMGTIDCNTKERVSSSIKLGEIVFYSNIINCINDISVIFICVGTPSLTSGECNISNIIDVFDTICKTTKKDITVVIKSTVPVGTCCKLIELSKKSKHYISIAFMPEFLRESTAYQDIVNPDRIIIGADDKSLFSVIDKLFNYTCAKLYTSINNAEMIKLASNAYLALRVSYVNEISQLCNSYKCDSKSVLKGMGMDHRIGSDYLNPSLGFGGYCLPKDTSFLEKMGETKELNLPLIYSILKSNNKNLEYYINIIKKTSLLFQNNKISILYSGFKKNATNIRNSRTILLAEKLSSLDYKIIIFEDLLFEDTKNYFINNKNVIVSKNLSYVIKESKIIFLSSHGFTKNQYRIWNKALGEANGTVIIDSSNKIKKGKYNGYEVL